MELTPSQKKTIRHQFDSFCKKVLREEARDYIRHINWRFSNEICLSELSEVQQADLYITDKYPSELFSFSVQGSTVTMKDEKLASAISLLSDDKRDIVLLSYFLDMTDKDIAYKLNMVRSTVQHRRVSTLKEIKLRMEIVDDGKQAT